MLRAEDARALIAYARSKEIAVLGIDAFLLEPEATRPSMEHSLAMEGYTSQISGDPWEAAIEFLRPYVNTSYFFEVVLDDA